MLTLGIGQLRQAAPRVSRSAVWIDTVRRGPFVREVSAPGALVSDDVRLLTARASGTVDRIHLKTGVLVQPDTLVLELSDPDLEFEALEAATDVKAARAELLDVQSTLGLARIEQLAEVEASRTAYREAKRRFEASSTLAEQSAIASLDAEQLRERAAELQQRVLLQEEHVEVLQSGGAARAAAKRARVEGLRAQAELRAAQVAALRVRAGAAGLLAELGVEVGERIEAGAVLGKMIDPDKPLCQPACRRHPS